MLGPATSPINSAEALLSVCSRWLKNLDNDIERAGQD